MAETTVSQRVSSVNETPLIHIDFLNENTPVVSTLDIAKHFQKKHKHVLDDIQRIISITPTSFTGPNFRPSTYTDSTGRKLRSYSLTRDAFSLLVMGFTGSAAIRWKLAYIEAFNSLEAAVLHNQTELAHEAGFQQGLDAARALPAAEADRKTAYLDGLKEGQRLQKRQDGFERLRKVVAYRAKGLSHAEIGRVIGVSRQAVSQTLQRARALGLAV